MDIKKFFGGDTMSQLNYLEEERKKIWAKIVEIEADLNKKTSDFEKEAKQASRKASEFRNRCEESKESADIHLDSIKKSHTEITSLLGEIKTANSTIAEIKEKIQELFNNSSISSEEIVSLESSIKKKIQSLETIFSNHPNLDNEIQILEGIFTEGEEIQSKINTLHKSALSRKKEIDQLYFDINGYTEEGEDGTETQVEGMKDELENSFEQIKENIAKFGEELIEFKANKEIEVEDFIENWSKKIEGINKNITELLPNALTAGLSHAYSNKKEAEETEAAKHSGAFHKSIFWLVIVSLIPFVVNIALWLQGKNLEQLILDMPRLVLAIMPLYIPLLWVAYSSNKKANLSKRLIEEYTHKEVLSKTFEGLSRQISSIDDKGISSELRIKLIYNILDVSAENPGKLITDYNKSDHPLMDALEKSVQLAMAVDKLSNIPGLSKISKVLDKKSKLLIHEKTLKAEEGLASISKETENTSESTAKAQPAN